MIELPDTQVPNSDTTIPKIDLEVCRLLLCPIWIELSCVLVEATRLSRSKVYLVPRLVRSVGPRSGREE